MTHPAGSAIAHGVIASQRVDRRSFLAMGSAAVSIAFAGLVPSQLQASVPAAIRYVVTDRRLKESLEFGEALRKQGSTRIEVTAGLTRIWQHSLLPLWCTNGGAVAGLTDAGVWNCLAEQARSHMRRSTRLEGHPAGLASLAHPSLVAWIIV